MSERQNNFFKAKLADQADRHTDMTEAMKSTVLMGEVLTVEERNMFSASYKNRIGKVRSSWRVLNSIERKETGVASEQSLCSYNGAGELGKELALTHPIRLGVALNLSVCYYETMRFIEKAVDLAKPALDDAIAELDKLNEESYRDSTLWTSALQQEEDTADGVEPENQNQEGDLDEMDKY
ncbi:14-3-3 protein epsilon-like [Drosophila obscura]|uniref:14-3-3 protein epsilon-like n=1 Tax=Drosophila obscura TaxID=7282 RepID=UPI001BB2327F|nr:14-3-3 protein epsilon-like [Drosophila obscura]